MTGVELAGPLIKLAGALIKPILDVWQIVRGLLRKRDDNTFMVPKRTLILIPQTDPFSLVWNIAPAPDGGEASIIAVGLRFQATNIASCNVRPSDVRVNWPRNIEIIQKIILTAQEDDLIGPSDIGEVCIHLWLRPGWVKPGDDLPIHIGVVDQFNNQHRLKIRCRFAG
jgi:hypothetical protein